MRLFNYAVGLYEKNSLELFERTYLEMLDYFPSTKAAELDKRVIEFSKKLLEADAESFIAFYEKAIARGCKIPELKELAGIAYERLGDKAFSNKEYEKALEAYRKSEEISPAIFPKIIDTYVKMDSIQTALSEFMKSPDAQTKQHDYTKQAGKMLIRYYIQAGEANLRKKEFSMAEQNSGLALMVDENDAEAIAFKRKYESAEKMGGIKDVVRAIAVYGGSLVVLGLGILALSLYSN